MVNQSTKRILTNCILNNGPRREPFPYFPRMHCGSTFEGNPLQNSALSKASLIVNDVWRFDHFVLILSGVEVIRCLLLLLS